MSSLDTVHTFEHLSKRGKKLDLKSICAFWTQRSDMYFALKIKNLKNQNMLTGDLTIIWDPLPRQEWNARSVYYRVYYRRTGIEAERDFQQKTLKNMPASNNLYVVRIPRRYYYTQHEVKVQVFNEMCQPPCEGPISEPVNITSGMFYYYRSIFLSTHHFPNIHEIQPKTCLKWRRLVWGPGLTIRRR